MKRNPPQKLLEDGIKLTCVLGAPFLTYKYIIVPYFKPEIEASDRGVKASLGREYDTQPGEGNLRTDIIYALNWSLSRVIGYGVPLALSFAFGYTAWETIEERYL